MPEPQDITKLRRALDAQDRPGDERMALADLFAAGCYLHQRGEKEAGRKACKTALLASGVRAKIYLQDVLDSLDGNEERYARDVWAHEEINELFGRPGE